MVFQRISFCCNCDWCWPGHLHTVFPRDILYETRGRGLPEPWWTVSGSKKSLGKCPLSHWTLHSGCNQHTLCFWRFHTCSVWAAPAISGSYPYIPLQTRNLIKIIVLNTRFLFQIDQKCANSLTYWQFFYQRPSDKFRYTTGGIAKNKMPRTWYISI